MCGYLRVGKWNIEGKKEQAHCNISYIKCEGPERVERLGIACEEPGSGADRVNAGGCLEFGCIARGQTSPGHEYETQAMCGVVGMFSE